MAGGPKDYPLPEEQLPERASVLFVLIATVASILIWLTLYSAAFYLFLDVFAGWDIGLRSAIALGGLWWVLNPGRPRG